MKNASHTFDIAVIGGGINGCGIAADAALRGLSTVLIEKNDLASHTSSASTKLIHGGLRYLEHFDFALVRKSLYERQTLLNIAPHLVRPMQFVIPRTNNARPAWMISLGLWIYDHLSAKNTLPKSHRVQRKIHQPLFSPLKGTFTCGHIYSDCATDDARLTLNNALLAKKHGAIILPHTEMMAGTCHDNRWSLTLKPDNKPAYSLSARVIVNAAGPWVAQTNTRLGIPNHQDIVLVKGSHLVVKKLYEGEQAYLLQHQDKRIIFVIPYHEHTLIGTTDVTIDSPENTIQITTEEINYLLSIVNQFFEKQLNTEDILTSWSGVRTLLAEKKRLKCNRKDFNPPHPNPLPQSTGGEGTGGLTLFAQSTGGEETGGLTLSARGEGTRDLTLSAQGTKGDCGSVTKPQMLSRDYLIDFMQYPAPALCIYGGKITTYRQLAAKTIDRLKPLFPSLTRSITHQTPLPGAEFANFDQFSWIPLRLIQRWMITYGARTLEFLSDCTQISDLGIHFGADLYQREVDYLITEEWATTCDDILWRRTKLGLVFNTEECKILENYVINYLKNMN